jgi:hypothetical protein
MLRVVLALIGLGGVLSFIGYQEYKVSEGTSKDPVPVSVVKLEYGIDLPNNHIEIGEHAAIYDALIYEYEQTFSDPTGDDPNTKVNFVYYPIVSQSHPLAEKLEQWAKRDPESITDEEFESLAKEKFKVLVRSGRYNKVSELPQGGVQRLDKVTGMVVNEISSVGWEEQRLIKEAFPNTDFKDILILQEGRKPSSPVMSFGMMGGGGALMLVGIGLMFVSRSF